MKFATLFLCASLLAPVLFAVELDSLLDGPFKMIHVYKGSPVPKHEIGRAHV